MTRYAFTDTGAGYYQGSQTADSLDEAIRLYAAHVGLPENIGLALRVAKVDAKQDAVLNIDNFNFVRLSDEDEAVANTIEWREISDEYVRQVLGFAPRKCDDESD